MEDRVLWMYNCEFSCWSGLTSAALGLPIKKDNIKCIVAAYSFVDAIDKIVGYYGEEAIDNISIEVIEDTDGGIMEVSKDLVVK